MLGVTLLGLSVRVIQIKRMVIVATVLSLKTAERPHLLEGMEGGDLWEVWEVKKRSGLGMGADGKGEKGSAVVMH